MLCFLAWLVLLGRRSGRCGGVAISRVVTEQSRVVFVDFLNQILEVTLRYGNGLDICVVKDDITALATLLYVVDFGHIDHI